MPTFFDSRVKFSGMYATLIAIMNELEAENARLEEMYSETQIKIDFPPEALREKYCNHL